MAVYEEKILKWYYAVPFLALVFMLIYPFYQIGDRDLYWSEGDFATMALEMQGMPPLPLAHGEIIPDTYPLYPMLAGLVHKTGMSMEFSLRIVSVLALALIVILVWETGRRGMDTLAAAVASAVMISTVLIAEKTVDGYPDMLALLFLCCGWFTWYNLGATASNWNLAWLSGFFFCGLAFYTIGWESILYFVTPLIFMRRPLTIWQKINKSGFYTGLAVLAFFILMWGIPRWIAGTDIPFSTMPLETASVKSYVAQLFSYPFEVAIRLMPWLIFAWAPLCVAFHPLEKNPIFSRFLRTILISLFFLLWILPDTKGRDMIILVPPMALLIGMNYSLAVRRYGSKIRKLLVGMGLILLAGAVGAMIYILIPAESIHDFIPFKRELFYKDDSLRFTFSILQVSLAAFCALLMVLYFRKRGQIWVSVLLFSLAAMLIFWGVINPYKAQDRSRSSFGKTLKEAIGADFSPDMTVYKDRRISGLYSESVYMGCKVRKVKNVSEIPEDARIIFFLSTEVPNLSNRAWKNLLERSFYRDKRIYLWKGEQIPKAQEKTSGTL